MFVKFELKKGLKGVKEFHVVTKMSRMKRLLDRSLNLVRLRKTMCHTVRELFCSVGGLKGFSLTYSDVGVEPK